MKVKFNVREHLEDSADDNGNLQVSTAIHLDDLFYDIPEEQEIDVDIDELLAENRRIAHIWSTDDVRQLRPGLDDDQGEVINRLRDMAGLLAKDIPGVDADVDPGSVRFFDHDETTSR